MAMTNQERAARIAQWAQDNYDNGADYIVECYSEAEIIEHFLHDWEGNFHADEENDLKRVKASVAAREEQRQEVESTIW